MDEQIVLEDDLLLEYFKFKNNEPCDNAIVQRLLTYYKPHLTNIEQLDRIKRGDNDLKQQLLQQRYKSENLEELVEKTSLKLILSKNKSDYPFVNILKCKDEPIESNYTATFQNVPRKKAIEHIKALCQTAKIIYIYDNFLNKYTENYLNSICNLFPKTNLTLICDMEQRVRSYWKHCNKNLNMPTMPSTPYKNFHDRYLQIDKKTEIILTSGFDHLFSEDGDFTYIVRLLK